jgi:hypothetical protein
VPVNFLNLFAVADGVPKKWMATKGHHNIARIKAKG